MDLPVAISVWRDELWYQSTHCWLKVPTDSVVPWLTQMLMAHPSFKAATREQRHTICRELMLTHQHPQWDGVLNGGVDVVLPLSQREVYCPSMQMVRPVSADDNISYTTNITWPQQLNASVTNTMNAFAASPEQLLALRKEMLRILTLSRHSEPTVSLWVGNGSNGRSTVFTALLQLCGNRLTKDVTSAATTTVWYHDKEAWQRASHRADYHAIIQVTPEQALAWPEEQRHTVVHFGIAFSHEGSPKVDSEEMRTWVLDHSGDILAWLVGPRPHNSN